MYVYIIERGTADRQLLEQSRTAYDSKRKKLIKDRRGDGSIWFLKILIGICIKNCIRIIINIH